MQFFLQKMTGTCVICSAYAVEIIGVQNQVSKKICLSRFSFKFVQDTNTMVYAAKIPGNIDIRFVRMISV